VGAAARSHACRCHSAAAALGKDYQPAGPEILVAGWQAGMPHLPLDAGVAVAPCGVAAGGAAAGGVAAGGAGRPAGSAIAANGAWRALLRASGRLPH